MKWLFFGVPKFLVGPKWIFGTILLSVLGGITTIRLGDIFWGGATNTAANVARPVAFLSTMTAIGTKMGMAKFTSKVRGVRHIVESGRSEQSLGDKRDG